MSTSPDNTPNFGDMTFGQMASHFDGKATSALNDATSSLRTSMRNFDDFVAKIQWFGVRWGKWILGFVALCMALSTASLVVLAVCAIL